MRGPGLQGETGPPERDLAPTAISGLETAGRLRNIVFRLFLQRPVRTRTAMVHFLPGAGFPEETGLRCRACFRSRYRGRPGIGVRSTGSRIQK